MSNWKQTFLEKPQIDTIVLALTADGELNLCRYKGDRWSDGCREYNVGRYAYWCEVPEFDI